MQCKNYVRDRKAGTSHSWDETLQPTHPWNQWEQMDRFRLTQNQHRRDSAIFWKRRWRAPWGRTHHVHEMKIVMGDLNAKVGNDNRNCERAMGREGCGTMNDNGERLLDTCTTYDFVIGRTLFPHRDVHKLTWYSPNGRDKNYIDHLMINGMCTQSLPNVRVRRWAAVGSDHHLVTTTLKLKLRKTRSSPRGRRHFDVEKLRDLKVKTAFILQLNN